MPDNIITRQKFHRLFLMNSKPAIAARQISLRPVVPEDENFLARLYFSTREDLLVLPIDIQVKNNLLQMQYLAQKQQYEWQFPNAAHDIVLFNEIPIGRFMVAREIEEICGVDLALLPEYRSLGIGTILLQNVFDEAARTNRIFSFHVLKTNRAARLYDRLGCSLVEDTGTHYKMEWRPAEIEGANKK